MLATELKTGKIFKENGIPYQVVKYEHIKVARGGANVKIKARNLISGATVEKGYSASAKVEDTDVMRKNSQYLYKENNGFVFMDPSTYEQVTVPTKVVGKSADFMKEGENAQILYFEGKPVSIDLPNYVIYKVVYTEPGFRGNTVTNTFKDAKLDNDLIVKVPMFIGVGDRVKIDTRSGDYISKA